MSTAWKDFERLVAKLVGGVRTWWTRVDVMTAYPVGDTTWGIECKHYKRLTINDIERIMIEAKVKSASQGIPPERTALALKRAAGAGVRTPVLLVYELTPPIIEEKVVSG